jgi:Amino acid synthesis
VHATWFRKAHFDTTTLAVAVTPRPNEILVVMTFADGGRLQNGCGTEPITKSPGMTAR